MQDFEPRPQPGVGTGESGSGDSLGQQDKALHKETRPWPRLTGAPGSGDFPIQPGGNLQVLETSSRPGEGKDETGWRDSSSQLEGALQTKTKPRPPLSGECVGVWVRASMDAKRNRKAPQPNDKRRSHYWITQRYAVKPEKVDEILKIFQVEPTVDTFADEGHHVLPRWWGSNGEKADAWNETWNFSVQGYLWMNPPFDDLGRVVDKLVQDQAKAILVCPHWPRDKWWKRVQDLVVGEIWYPKGTKLFLRNGEPMRGTKWGVHAYLVNGAMDLTSRVLNMLEVDTEKSEGKLTSVNMFKLGDGHQSEGEEQRVEAYRQKVKEDYEGAVFGSKVPKDPLKRSLWRSKDRPQGRSNTGSAKTVRAAWRKVGGAQKGHSRLAGQWVHRTDPRWKSKRGMVEHDISGAEEKSRRVERGGGHARTKQHDQKGKLPPPRHRGPVGETRGKPHLFNFGPQTGVSSTTIGISKPPHHHMLDSPRAIPMESQCNGIAKRATTIPTND